MARIVLVADDSPTIQKRAVGILKGEGFEVETVSNGVAAIKRLAVLHPTVILADVSMPGRDGYEVCDFVKKSPNHSLVPVLLVASDMEPYDNARGAEVRADGIIIKPFEAHELVSVVVKFANQFEASMAAISATAAPPAPPKPAPEFAAFSEGEDGQPTVLHPVASDFSAAPEGMAFAEPAVDAEPGYSAQPFPGTMQAPAPDPGGAPLTYELAGAPTVEIPVAAEEQFSPAGPPPAYSMVQAASYPYGLEAAAPEPVFIEEQPAQVFEPPSAPLEGRTMIFRAPREIADPVWMDETVPAPPPAEPVVATAPAPQFAEEIPAAPQEYAVEQQIERPYSAAPEENLSASEPEAAALEVALPAPEAEAAALEVLPPALEPESAAPEVYSSAVEPEAAVLEVAPSAPEAETAAPEVYPSAPELGAAVLEVSPSAPEAEATAPEVYPLAPELGAAVLEVASPAPESEAAAPEIIAPVPEPESAALEVAPTSPESEAAASEVYPLAPELGAAVLEVASPAPESEAAASEVYPPAPEPEAAVLEVAPSAPESEAAAPEVAVPAPWPEAAAPEAVSSPPMEEAAVPVDTPPVHVSEAVPAEITVPEPVLESTTAERSALEAAPEILRKDSALQESVPVAPQAEPSVQAARPPDVAAPPPAVDWALVYTVVHKIVLRMAPPALPQEVVEDLARRLADEVFIELSTEAVQPQA